MSKAVSPAHTARVAVIAVVGPSGVGKDSVMAAMCEVEPKLSVARRVITRAPDLGGEPCEAVTQKEFDRRDAAGEFCLQWRAHGLCYAIPRSVRERAARGQRFLVNLSRAALPEADRVFGGIVVLQLSASVATLAARLTARGRETTDDIAARLHHTGAPLPTRLPQVTIANEGTLRQTAAEALAALTFIRSKQRLT